MANDFSCETMKEGDIRDKQKMGNSLSPILVILQY